MTGILQILHLTPVLADDGGYPWVGATYVDSNYDWGYSNPPSGCPSSDTGCGSTLDSGYGVADPWGYDLRNCTSYVAWKINQVFGVNNITGWGNAATWNVGYTNKQPYTVYNPGSYTPQVGDIAQWGTEKADGAGHVAYVYAVSSGIASLDEYNVAGTGLFTSNRTTASTSAGTPDHYIHIGTISPAPPVEVNYLIYRSGNNLYGKQGLGDVWSTLSSAASDVKAEGTCIAMKDTSGNIWVKDTLGGVWYEETNAVDQYAVSSNYILTLNNHTLQGKAGLNDVWSTLSTGATDMKVAGTRIAALDNSGNLWAKDGLNGTWYEETGPVDQYIVTPSYIIYRSGNNLYGKAALNDPWSTLSTSAADVQADGTRVAMKDTSGEIWTKDTLGGVWNDESTSVDQYAVSLDYLLTRSSNTVQGKVGLNDVWSTLYTSANSVETAGSRVAVSDTNGSIWAKDSLGGLWQDETSSADQYVVTSTLAGEP